MTNFKHLKNKSEGQQKDELLSTLFQHASARPKAPLDDEAAIRAAVFTQWQKITGQRKQKRYLTAFGLAASLVVAVILINNLQEQPQPVGKPQQLAHIEIRRGDVFRTQCSGQEFCCPPFGQQHALCRAGYKHRYRFQTGA